MESVPVVALAFILCCLLCSLNGGSSQCLDNLPQYGSRGTGSDVPRLPSSNIYIIPNYTFSCYGNMTQWGACVEPEGGEHNIVFSVYRPSDDPLFPDCYSIVGNNVIVDGTATDGCITLNVPVSDQISVEPGDVVGFSTTSNNNDNGIETDATVSSVTTWYNTLDNFGIGPPDCPFRPGPGGNFPISAPAAPVITAVVGPSTPSPSHSTSSHSTSSHSPVPSTPSPSHSTSSHLPVTSTPLPSHSTSSHSPVPSTPSPSHSTSSHSPVPSTIPSPSSPTQDGGSTLSTSTVAGIAVGAMDVVLLITIMILLTIYKFRVKSTSTGNLSATNIITMEQNEAYHNTIAMEQNEAYSGTVVGATQDESYEEVDGLYEEVH